MSSCYLNTHLPKSSMQVISMYTTKSGWTPLTLMWVVGKLTLFQFSTIWKRLLNKIHVFLIVTTKHLTLLTYSLPLTLFSTLELSLPHLALRTTVSFLFLVLSPHPLLFLQLNAMSGTLIGSRELICGTFSMTFHGRIIASGTVVLTWLPKR